MVAQLQNSLYPAMVIFAKEGALYHVAWLRARASPGDEAVINSQYLSKPQDEVWKLGSHLPSKISWFDSVCVFVSTISICNGRAIHHAADGWYWGYPVALIYELVSTLLQIRGSIVKVSPTDYVLGYCNSLLGVKGFIMPKEIDAQQVLQVPYSHSAHAVADEMDFALTVPASWETIRKGKDSLRATNLFEILWHIVLTHRMLFLKVSVPIYSTGQFRSTFIRAESVCLSNIVDTYELLIQFTCSIMSSTKRRNSSHIDITTRLNPSFQSVFEVVAQ